MQKISPFIEVKYGWDYGESGWNSGVDEDLLKFSFLFDANVDAIVDSLPTPTEGKSYFLTTDNRLYFVVGGLYYSTPCPDKFVFGIKSTSTQYQKTSSGIELVTSNSSLSDRVELLELTKDSLGTAAFVDSSTFSTPGEVDVKIAAESSELYSDYFNNIPSVWDYMSNEMRNDCLSDAPSLDHSTAFQAAVDAAIQSGVKRLFVPFGQRQRYKFNQTVLIESSGFAVIGDSFPQFNLNGFAGATGILPQVGTGYIFGEGVTSLFDYGNDRTDLTSNQLVFEGVSFFGSNKNTTNAVRFSQNNNGPHRGVLFRNCSGGEFTNVVLFDCLGPYVVAASVVVETCSFRNNINAVKANKEVFNFRFVGNQSEQGAHIDGFFDGGVTIDDNMLEGQQNAVKIDALTAQVSLRNNYFELNSGDYLVSLHSATMDSSLSLEPNYIVLPETTDLYKMSGGWRIYENYVNSQIGATADRKASITAHDLLVVPCSRVSGRFNLASSEVASRTKLRGYTSPAHIITTPPANSVLTQRLGTTKLLTPNGTTPYGAQVTGVAGSTFNMSKSFAAGDAVTVCALVYTRPSSDTPAMRVLDQTNTLIGIECSQIAMSANRAGWHIMFASGVVTGGGTEVRVQFDSGGGSTMDIAAIGCHVTPAANFESYNSIARPYVEIFNPFDVNYQLTASMTYDPPSLAAGAGETSTISVPGVVLGDIVAISFDQNLDQVTLTGWVSANGVVRFRLQNDSGVVKDLASGTLKVTVIK